MFCQHAVFDIHMWLINGDGDVTNYGSDIFKSSSCSQATMEYGSRPEMCENCCQLENNVVANDFLSVSRVLSMAA